ncbi:MAG TPA: hypothetical protein VNZ52_06290, partial [Candidatus Thermoplasmatota archaeon]|nr:hypothetical protein [Candidatus Thermoplasmatota archaeon]
RIPVHVAVLGEAGVDPAPLRTLAARSGGTFHEGTKEPALRTALRALADRLGVPLDLPPAPGAPVLVPSGVEEEVEFEIIVTPISPEEPRFPFRRRD